MNWAHVHLLLNHVPVLGTIFGVVLLAVCAAGMVQARQQGYPPDQLLFGLVPLNSPGHMLHLATGSIALYFGFAKPIAARN